MKNDNSTKKPFSIKGPMEGVVVANILGILTWLFPLVCKGWLLHISPEEFYGQYTSTLMYCATWPILQSIILFYHAMWKKDISISKVIKAYVWMISAINIATLLFITIAEGVICDNVEMSGYACLYIGEFILQYGLIYVAAMLLSALLGVIVLRRIKKGEGMTLGSNKQ